MSNMLPLLPELTEKEWDVIRMTLNHFDFGGIRPEEPKSKIALYDQKRILQLLKKAHWKYNFNEKVARALIQKMTQKR